MDGWVIVGTKLDTKQLEKDIKLAEKELQQYEKEGEKLTKQKAKVDVDLKSYEEQKRQIQETTNKTLELAQTEEQVNFLLQQEDIELEQLKTKYSDVFQKNNDINKKIQENTKNQGLLNNKITEMNKELNRTKGFNAIKNGIKETNSSMNGVLKKVAKWSLAIFGIRSAYTMVRRAMSTLSQYNEQMATNIEYINYALASALEPVIKRIISLVQTLLTYINYIAYSWFKINLFASAKQFEKMKKSAKEINKQLQSAGFDEMNILNDSSSKSTAATPSLDLGNWENIEIPEWVKWIAENKDIVIAGLLGIAGALSLLKLSNLASDLGLVGQSLSLIKTLGIGVMIFGIVLAIQSLIEYLKDPSFKNFGSIFQGIGIAIIGVGIAIAGLPGIIVGAIVLIIGTIIKYWDEIKVFFQKGIDWLAGKSDWIHDTFGDTIGNIYDLFVNNLQGILDWFDTLFTSMKYNFDQIIQFVKNVFTGNWKGAWENIKNIFSNIWNFIKKTATGVLNGLINSAKTIVSTVGNVIASVFKAVVNSILGAIENVLNSPIKAVNKLIGVINEVPGINLKKLSTFNLPRLAVGGIISMPGKGIPIGMGQAVGGEAGREGVIPLTDAQAMSELGRAIGEYITINMTNITKLDNRQIAREQKKIQNQNDFVYNR